MVVRWQKNFYEKNEEGHDRRIQYHFLHDEPTQPALCPVDLLLPLAFADYAFKEEDMTSECLMTIKEAQASNSMRQFRWKKAIQEKPVLQGTCRGNKNLSPDLSLVCNTFLKDYLNLIMRAGHRQHHVPYSKRCCTPNTIEERVSIA